MTELDALDAAIETAAMLDTKKIKKLRRSLGLTQQEAADGAQIKSRQRWNEIESGTNTNVTLETLGRIAKALKCKPIDLIKN